MKRSVLIQTLAIGFLGTMALFGDDKKQQSPGSLKSDESYVRLDGKNSAEGKRLLEWKTQLSERKKALNKRWDLYDSNPVDENEAKYLKGTGDTLNDEIERYNAAFEIFTNGTRDLELRRSVFLRQEIATLKVWRSKLDAELAKVGSRSNEELAFRLGTLNYLELADSLLDLLIESLPPDARTTAKEVKEALKAIASAWGSPDEAKKLEALGKAIAAARGSLRNLPGITKQVKAVLEATNHLYSLGFASVKVYEEWDRDHNVAQLRSNMVSLVEEAVGVAEAIPAAGNVVASFKYAWEFGSVGVLLVNKVEEAQAIGACYEKQHEAQRFLRSKIEEVDAHIAFKQRKLHTYEKRNTKN